MREPWTRRWQGLERDFRRLQTGRGDGEGRGQETASRFPTWATGCPAVPSSVLGEGKRAGAGAGAAGGWGMRRFVLLRRGLGNRAAQRQAPTPGLQVRLCIPIPDFLPLVVHPEQVLGPVLPPRPHQ